MRSRTAAGLALAGMLGGLAGCGGGGAAVPPAWDEPMWLAAEAAEASVQDGQAALARARFGEARREALLRGDSRAAARYLVRMAACAIAEGEGAGGERMLEVAGLESRVAGDAETGAEAGLLRGRLLLERGDAAGAWAAGETVLRGPAGRSGGRLVRDAHLLRAEAALRLGEPARARTELESLRRRDQPADGTAAGAVWEQAWGGVLEGEGRFGEAADRLAAAADGWRRLRRHEAGAWALERSARLRARAGEAGPGAEGLFRAARMWRELGRHEQAAACMGAAASLAAAADLPELAELARLTLAGWGAAAARP